MTWAEGVFLATHPGQAEAKLDRADQAADGRSTRRATVTRHAHHVLPDRPCSRRPGRRRRVLAGGASSRGRASPIRGAQPASAGAAAPRHRRPASTEAAFLKRSCITCHNQRAKIGGLALDTLDVARVGPASETLGEGRPEDPDRHDAAERRAASGARPRSTRFAAALETRLDRAVDPKRGARDAGAASAESHRVRQRDSRSARARRRREHAAAGRRLEPRLRQPRRSAGVSPSLIQGYVSAAMKISRLAVGDRTMAPSQTTYRAAAGAGAGPAHRRAAARHARRHGRSATRSRSTPSTSSRIGGRGGGRRAASTSRSTARRSRCDNPRGFRIKVTAGPHTIGRRAGRSAARRRRGRGLFGLPHERDVHHAGRRADARRSPARSTRPAPATRRAGGAIFTLQAGDVAGRGRRRARARSSRTLARRAYRGPVSAAEVDTLIEFYEQGRQAGDFERGIQQALARMLVAPRFVYRIEEEPATVAAGAGLSHQRRRARLAPVVLPVEQHPGRGAARPGDEGPAARSADAARSRSSGCSPTAKADALVENFAGQWLYLRELATRADRGARTSTRTCAASFRRETEMLFDAIVREDRSLIDLLDADYTFVDERLARHYGIPNVRQLLPPRVAGRRQPAPRPARPGQHADGDVDRHAHVAGRRAASGSWRTCSARRRRSRHRASRRISAAQEGAKTSSLRAAAGGAPREPDVRVVPQHHGPDGLRARELRSGRQLARVRRPEPDRLDGPAGRRHAGERTRPICARRC